MGLWISFTDYRRSIVIDTEGLKMKRLFLPSLIVLLVLAIFGIAWADYTGPNRTTSERLWVYLVEQEGKGSGNS